MIKAEIVAHSKRKGTGEELITFELTFPRIILSELNTHRQISKNTSSHRAVKFEKLLQSVKEKPFIPYAWQKEHKGMQGKDYFEEPFDIQGNELAWLEARDSTVEIAQLLYKTGNSKQNINRLLEPFTWVKQVATANRESFEWLFELRCPNYDGCKSWKELCNLDSNYTMETPLLERLKINTGMAEIHFSLLAEMMYDELNNSTPTILSNNDFHIPYLKEINKMYGDLDIETKKKISVSICAGTSYTIIGDDDVTPIEKHLQRFNNLWKNKHLSPFEQIAKCMTNDEYRNYFKGNLSNLNDSKSKGWCKNFKGFVQLRENLENGK